MRSDRCLNRTDARAARSEVRLPDLGKVDIVTIVAWLKKEGELLTVGEDLLEVETEKTTFVIDAPKEGKLLHILKKEGERVQIDDLLAEIE